MRWNEIDRVEMVERRGERDDVEVEWKNFTASNSQTSTEDIEIQPFRDKSGFKDAIRLACLIAGE